MILVPQKGYAMELLLNPNTAYVLLVVGVLLGLLAIVTPGTGFLEVAAFFCLALTAYVAFNIGTINPWALVVLAASLIPFIYSTRGLKRRIWLAVSIAGVLVGSLYLFNTSGWIPEVNPILALIVSGLAGGFVWLVVDKAIQAYHARPSHDLGSLIGQVGEAKTDVHENGSVQVSGELWSARSEKKLPAGTFVRVVGREGFILIVEKSG
jgi:membrane-bound ClpP family serine protease